MFQFGGLETDLFQSTWAFVLAALGFGSGELPQPKSAPVADFREGLVIEKPDTGVAMAGSFVFHSLDAHGSAARDLNVVLVGGAEDCIKAL